MKYKIKNYLNSEKGKKLIYYGISGAITTVISFVTYKVFLDVLKLHYVLAFSMSWILAVTFAYLSTRVNVYDSKADSKKEKASEYVRFIIGRVITYLVNLGLLVIAVEWLGLDKFWSNVVITIIVIILNYFIGNLTINFLKIQNIKSLVSNIDNNRKILFIILGVITIFAIIVRIPFLNIESLDYVKFLSGWFNHLKENGGIKGILSLGSDYNLVYLEILALLTYIPVNSLYLIKTVSIIFDIALALSCMSLVSRYSGKNAKSKIITYVLVLFMPTIVLNSSAWAQCDSIYATFVILSLSCLIDKKYIKCILLYGVALSFKLQAIFLLPVFALIFLGQKDARKKVLYTPLVLLPNFILSLPAIVSGNSIVSVFKIYSTQVGEYIEYISQNISNIYHLIYFTGDVNIEKTSNGVFISMLILTFAIFLIIYICVVKRKIILDKKNILLISLWSVLVSLYFLPCMHDRYLYLADVLSIICFTVFKDTKIINLMMMVNVEIISFCSYAIYLFGKNTSDMVVLSIVYLLTILILTYFIFKGEKNEKIICNSSDVQ